MFPERFNNKTNGVTPRRWLLLANPALAGAITEAIGDGWITDLAQLARLAPLADDAALRDAFREAKREAKARFADWLRATYRPGGRPGHDLRLPGQAHPRVQAAAPECAAHRRALQPPARESPARHGAAHVLLRGQGGARLPARQADHQVHQQPRRHHRRAIRPCAAGSRSLFLPEYCVSLAERLIPASDVSNQISTAGYEASGTSNMKFMMNGALTIGTRDGATIEMAAGGGRGELVPVRPDRPSRWPSSRGWYNPHWHYEHERGDARGARPDLRRSLQPRTKPGVFAPLRDALLAHGDHYMHLADLSVLSRGGRAARRAVRRSAGLGAEGDPQRGRVGEVLERPDDRRVRERDLARQAVPGRMRELDDGSQSIQEVLHGDERSCHAEVYRQRRRNGPTRCGGAPPHARLVACLQLSLRGHDLPARTTRCCASR